MYNQKFGHLGFFDVLLYCLMYCLKAKFGEHFARLKENDQKHPYLENLKGIYAFS